MILTKIKIVGFVAAAFLFTFGVMFGVHQASAERPPIDPPPAKQRDATKPQALAPVSVVIQEKKVQPKGRKKDEIAGIVKAIDIKVGTLLLTFTGDGKRGEQLYNLASLDMKVPTSLGLTSQLSDLVVGTRIHIQLTNENITAIRADHPAMPVAFASVDADKKMVTVRSERGSDSYQVADNAKITVNGKPGKLADVPTKQKTFVTLSLDKKTILVLSTGKAPREGEPGGKGRVRNFIGMISKMDGDKMTVTMRGENGERSDIFTITKETSILIETDQDETVKGEGGDRKKIKIVEGKLPDLKVGQRVTVSTDQGVRTLTVVIMRMPKQLKDGK